MTRIFDDPTMTAIEFALTGLNKRQQTTAHNIANVNTPGFHSSRVRFEDELSDALRAGRSPSTLEARRVAANTPINARGNDVSLEQESQDLITSGIQYEALVNALNFKFGILRSAIRGS